MSESNDSLKNLINASVSWLVSNAALLSKSKFSGVHYVENEMFKTGVYRVHLNSFTSVAMRHFSEIDTLISNAVAQYKNVVWDKNSLWLTVYPEMGASNE